MKLKSLQDLPAIPRSPKPALVFQSFINSLPEDLSFADRFVDAIHNDYAYYNPDHRPKHDTDDDAWPCAHSHLA